MSADEIDRLLEQYLSMVDKYTNLREELGTLQSSVHQSIARANFSSDRGIRYGQDYYDERMQATTLVHIDTDALSSKGISASSTPHIFSIASPTPPKTSPTITSTPRSSIIYTPSSSTTTTPRTSKIYTPTTSTEDLTSTSTSSSSSLAPRSPSDPIKMFGLLAPPALKHAQASAQRIVYESIPALATLNYQMLNIEIRIRQARKAHARAVAKQLEEEAVSKDHKKRKDHALAVAIQLEEEAVSKNYKLRKDREELERVMKTDSEDSMEWWQQKNEEEKELRLREGWKQRREEERREERMLEEKQMKMRAFDEENTCGGEGCQDADMRVRVEAEARAEEKQRNIKKFEDESSWL